MKKKILLVDDATLFLDLAKQILKPTGAEILTARSGVDALKVLEAEKPDLIILDLMMPDMGGDKVCMHVKRHPRLSEIPVIMVTSRGRSEELEKCRQAGCDDFLTKPIKGDLLLEKISRLGNKAARRHSIQTLLRVESEGQTGKEVCFGTSGDLSKSGISVFTEKQLDVGQSVVLRFFLAANPEEMVMNGQIVRRESRDRTFFYGVHFINPTDQQLLALDAFMEMKNRASR